MQPKLSDIKPDLGMANGEGKQDALEQSDQLLKKATPKRWLVLVLFCLNSANKAFQWIQIPAATLKMSHFYEVENYVINFASIIYILNFLVLSWPACIIIERIGIRRAVVLASLGASLGSIIKWLSCYQSDWGEPGSVWLMLLGQMVVSLSEQLIFSVPSRLAAVWFPDHQVSFAMALCLLGNQTGIAVGFVLSPWLLDRAETLDDIGQALNQMFAGTAALSCVLLVLNYMILDEAPKHPPGEARLKKLKLEMETNSESNETTNNKSLATEVKVLFKQVVRLCKDGNLMLLASSYGIAFARADTISTLLDQLIQPIFPGHATIVGITGCLIIITGAFALPIWGRILDATHAYKRFHIAMSLCTLISLISFAYATLWLRSALAVYLSAALFGIFQTSFLVAGLEMAIELTYPNPELITSTLLNVMPSLMSPIGIMIGSLIVDNLGPLAAFTFYTSTIFMGFICILSTREDLKRQQAIQQLGPAQRV